jgi:regulator of protease activity HflC (stomatin/prohibitin superfamily)
MMLDSLTYAALAIVVIIFLALAIRILREYERGVVFTLGRFTGVKGPGLIILIPAVQQMVNVDWKRLVAQPFLVIDVQQFNEVFRRLLVKLAPSSRGSTKVRSPILVMVPGPPAAMLR